MTARDQDHIVITTHAASSRTAGMVKAAAMILPRSAYLVVIGMAAIFVAALGFVYEHTRDAYRSVGSKDGQVYQRDQMIKGIERSMRVLDCDSYKDVQGERIEFLSAKADSIYAVVADDGSVRFCRDY